VLERNRNVEPAAMPDLGGLPTLAEELLARQTQHPRKIGTLRQNPYPMTAKRVVQILSFEMLKIWMDLAIQECESDYCDRGSLVERALKTSTLHTPLCRLGIGFLHFWRFCLLSSLKRCTALGTPRLITGRPSYKRMPHLHSLSATYF